MFLGLSHASATEEYGAFLREPGGLAYALSVSDFVIAARIQHVDNCQKPRGGSPVGMEASYQVEDVLWGPKLDDTIDVHVAWRQGYLPERSCEDLPGTRELLFVTQVDGKLDDLWRLQIQETDVAAIRDLAQRCGDPEERPAITSVKVRQRRKVATIKRQDSVSFTITPEYLRAYTSMKEPRVSKALIAPGGGFAAIEVVDAYNAHETIVVSPTGGNGCPATLLGRLGSGATMAKWLSMTSLAYSFDIYDEPSTEIEVYNLQTRNTQTYSFERSVKSLACDEGRLVVHFTDGQQETLDVPCDEG